MGEEMPRFNATATCPKCGSDNIGTVHHPEDHGYRYAKERCYGVTEEHIDRTCRNCFYGWQEVPLDVWGREEAHRD